jgi:tetratricopeptide (TPR) repeat protein
MRCIEEIAALALRRYLVYAPQLVSSGERIASSEDAPPRLDSTKAASALRCALGKVWLAVEIVLAGEDFCEQLRSTFVPGRESVYQSLRRFLAAVSSGLVDRPAAETLRLSWLVLREALHFGLLNLSDSCLRKLNERASAGIGHSSVEEASDGEREELEQVIEELQEAGHGHLRPILELRWRGREPLVLVMLAAFFAADIEADRDEASDGAFPSLARLVEPGFEEFRDLAEVLAAHRTELSELLETFWSTHSTSDVKTGAARFECGRSYLQCGDYEGAVAEFTRLLRFDRKSADAFAFRAEAHRLNGNYKGALADYDAAHQLDSHNGRVLFNRGLVRWVLGDYDAAIGDYTAALQVGPGFALAYLNRGIAYAARGDDEAALGDFNQALLFDPSYPSAYQKRGDIYVRKGDVDRAIADYTQVFRFNPFCALTYVKRGDAHRSKGDLERAIADYGSAVEVDPLNVTAHVHRGLVYRELKRYELALADLSQALRLEGENCDFRYQRALTHRMRRDYRAALADFDKAVALRPSDPHLVYERGCTYQMWGDLDKALEDFNTAVVLKPDFALAYKSKGAIHLSRNHVDQAIIELGAALEADPNLTRAYLKRASAWTKKGRLDEAIRDCEQALHRDSNLAGAYLLRASALARQGAYEAADADFSRALQLEPNNAHAHNVRGVTAMKQGDFVRALADFTNSFSLNPNNARTLFLRGTVYQTLEQHERALADLNQAVLLDPQYTAAFCNQRALIHAANCEYELALAEYAIVLQLDRTNLTALLGRERALQALQSQPTQGQEPTSENGAGASSVSPAHAPSPRRTKKRRLKTETHPPAPATQIHPVSRATDIHAPILTQETEVEVVEPGPSVSRSEARMGNQAHGEQSAAIASSAEATDAPAARSETRPERATTQPAAVDKSVEGLLEPTQGARDTASNDVGNPILARVAVQQRRTEETERARLWAEMRFREHLVQAGHEREGRRLAFSSEGGKGIGRRAGIVAAAVAVLLLVGGGAYYAIFVKKSEERMTAAHAWEEFAKDTPGANQKYKGKFVRITGPIRKRAEGQATRLFFEAPEDAKWAIEFTLPAAQQTELKEGEEITLRCRFGTRKEPDGNLLLSNCTVLKEN